MSGYEGSELLVARLLVESGADLRYVGTACPRTPWSEADRDWLARAACRCSTAPRSKQDLAALREFEPDLAIGTTPVVQAAKRRAIPALYFTNLISARPLMGPGGAGRWPRCQRRDRPTSRASTMRDFFGASGVGRGPRRRLDRGRARPARNSAPSSSARSSRSPARKGRGDGRGCWSSTTTGRAATGARSTSSPRSRACRSSSTARSAARTCR